MSPSSSAASASSAQAAEEVGLAAATAYPYYGGFGPSFGGFYGPGFYRPGVSLGFGFGIGHRYGFGGPRHFGGGGFGGPRYNQFRPGPFRR